MRIIETIKDYRIGEVRTMNCGGIAKIISYTNCEKITIQFQDKFEHVAENVQYANFIRGSIRNPYSKTTYGRGYFGVGKYNTKEHMKAFKRWSDMFLRCYDPYYLNNDKYIAYRDVVVCEEWHNYQVFAEWYYENYVEGFELDKDFLFVGNRVYSPQTCIFLPKRINIFIANKMRKRENSSGGHAGISIRKLKNGITYVIKCNNFDTSEEIYLGRNKELEYAIDIYNKYRYEQSLKAYKYMLECGFSEDIAKLIIGR